MIALDIPAPELSWEPSGAPQLEQPVALRLPAIRYPDGAEAPEDDAQTVGAYVYRLGSAGEEFWNETEERWTAVPADPSSAPPVPLAYNAGDPRPWQGELIAIGMKDKEDKDRFAKLAGGEPRYRLRAYAHFKRDGADYAGLSAPSSDLAFVSGLEGQRFKIDMTPADLQQTEKVTLQLRNASLAPAAYIEIRTSGGNQVEIANCTAAGAKLAVVRLEPDGTVRVVAQKLVIEGDLEARHIRYIPAGGTLPVDLP